MSKLDALNDAWRNFSVERGRARTVLLDQTDRWAAEIAERQKWITDANNQFEREWKERKATTRAALDEAVKARLREGRSAQSVLHELGSNNTVWIYKLLAEVRNEGTVSTAGTPGAKVSQATAPVPVFQEPQVQQKQQDTTWRHHDHLGVHGWLISEDGTQVKKYGAIGTDFEDEYFISDTEGNFLQGNRALFEHTPAKEILSRSTMLADLLAGTYTGKLREKANPYTR